MAADTVALSDDVAAFQAEALAWFEANANPRPRAADVNWGSGSDSVALFRNLNQEDERLHIETRRRWVQRKADAGLANVAWEVQWGGRALPPVCDAIVNDLEEQFLVPPTHESVEITTILIAPTIRAVGTPQQHERFLRRALRTDDLWCQLFSEPGAGSDLAGLATVAERDGDEWVLNGQKVWTSGAQFADWGYVLCRTDPSVPKHRGLTAFAVPMSAPGVEVRPLRQMTGGSSFNEVFFTDVRVPDADRLGGIGEGWRVALTTLGYERGSFEGPAGSDATMRRLIGLARHVGREGSPLVRQGLARAYIHQRLTALLVQRVKAQLLAGDTPGPEASLVKLAWTQGLQLYNEVASTLLGPMLVADSGEWGTYAWAEHVLGAPGYRIAGGSDEVLRNILGERVLGLPSDPRVDRDIPFSRTAGVRLARLPEG